MSLSFVFVGDEQAVMPFITRLCEAGFRYTENPAAAEVVLSLCASQSETEDLYLDSEGLIATCAPGTLLVDLSATTPDFTKELQTICLINNLRMVDAPLFVDNPAVSDVFSHPECLRLFMGGAREDKEAVRELLSVLAYTLVDCGEAGAGQHFLSCMALQNVAQILALMEALALCKSRDTSEEELIAQTRAAGLMSDRVYELYQAVSRRSFKGDFTLSYLLSQLTMALSAADDACLILPHAEAAQHIMELLAVIGGSGKSPAALSLVYSDDGECAKVGLDWDRAEQLFGDQRDMVDDSFSDDLGIGRGYLNN